MAIIIFKNMKRNKEINHKNKNYDFQINKN